MNISDKLNNISLVLYGDEAEMSMTSYYLDYLTAYRQYKLAFSGTDVDTMQKLATVVADREKALSEVEKLRNALTPDMQDEQKAEILKKTEALLERITALEAEMTVEAPEVIKARIGGYSDEQKAQILQAEKALYTSRDNLLKLFAMCLKKDDRETNVFTAEELLKLSKKEKEDLILAIASEPDNGIQADFLNQLVALKQ